MGAPKTFHDHADRSKLWQEWEDYLGDLFFESPQEAGKKVGGATKQTSDFGSLYALDEETGLPVVPGEDELAEKAQKQKGEGAKYWQALVRQFMNAHYSWVSPRMRQPMLIVYDRCCLQ